ncbi:MAG: hypothetical protein ACI9KE_001875 [Polyangiales bacterium]|jgi:hypothetical protein
MLRFFGLFLACALALACGSAAPVAPPAAAAQTTESSAIRWQKETPMGVRGLEMLPGGDLLFFAAGQEPAPPLVVRSHDGLETGAYPLAIHPDARMTSGDDKVLVVRRKDLDVYKVEGGRLFHVELPEGAGSIAAFASGYAESAFVVTSQGVLHIATPSGLRRVETSAVLSGASHMQRVGGQLVIARGESLWSVSLSNGEVSEWATGLGSVREFVRDDEGYYIVLNGEREVWRVHPDGTASRLSSGPEEPLVADHIAYDREGHTLAIVDTEHSRLQGYDYLALTARTATPSDRVGPFTVVAGALGSAGLSGAEYWPFLGDAPPNYPADILWGFYPEQGVMFDGEVMSASASDAAVACMERSHAALHAFVGSHASALVEAERVAPEETSARFYLWMDDYSVASDPFLADMREAKMWYWQRDPAVPGRIPGYWKWETVLHQDGECSIPDTDAASVALQERIRGARE